MKPGPSGETIMNRADAFALLTEYVKNPNLSKHMLAVEPSHPLMN